MSPSATDLPGEFLGCRHCGQIQHVPYLPREHGRGTLRCCRCDGVIARTRGENNRAALAFALAAFLLLFPANLCPLLKVEILGQTNRSIIFSGAAGIWRQHWPVVAIIIGLELVVLPFFRFGLLAAVLSSLRLGWRPAWLGPAFRWAEALDEWAMLDVFLLGGIIGYFRIAPFLPIEIEAGGVCAIALSFLTLVTRASLNRREIWRKIGPVVDRVSPDMIVCSECALPAPADRAGRPCPRCGATVWPYRPYSLMRAIALTAAGFILYVPSYLYPMQYSDQLNTMVGYSIMTGVSELFKAGLWYFGILIFVFSVITPLLKLFAFAWFGISIHERSTSRLRTKARLYRAVDAVGRWSHVDPFTVSVFLPLMVFPGYLSVVVGWALPAFLGVVVLTMFATRMFDPRLLWRFAPPP